jgi:RNA polymerase sigma-70 factor (ECF subfamily)
VHDWPQILEEFGPVVWRHALRILGKESDAADCFQSVMLEAVAISRRKEIRNWPALLKRLATVRSLDHLRSRCRHAAVPLPETGLDDPASKRAVDLIDDRDLAEQLRLKIASLPHDQAEAFTLRFVHGLSNQEVADTLEITTNHATVLIHRARSTLRDQLSQQQEKSQ